MWAHTTIYDRQRMATPTNQRHESCLQLTHERKEQMLRDCDIAIALPGGCGTFEEFMEALIWRQLELYKGRLIILNTKIIINHY